MTTAHVRDGVRLLTAADVARLPRTLPSGGVRYELHDGRLVLLPLPDRAAGRTQALLMSALGRHGEDRGFGEAGGRVGILLRRNPDHLVAPAATFRANHPLPPPVTEDDYLLAVPELVVEVRIGCENRAVIDQKVRDYLVAGAALVWVADPAARTVTAHRPDLPDHVFAEADTLTCPLIPGFAVPVAKLFDGS